MNILCFSWRGPKHPQAGGAEISAHEHAKGWVKAGHKVTLFTSTYEGAKAQECINGVNIIRKGSQFLSVQLHAFRWFLFEKKEKYDLVIDEFHGIPFFTPFFVRSKKIGFIHETTKEVWKMNSLKAPLNLLPAVFGTIIEPIVFKLLYKNIPFITVSESTKKDLIQWGVNPGQITIVHNGLSVQKYLPIKKNTKKTLLFLGALSKDKGIDIAIKVFQQINNEDKGWQFWVAGKAEKNYLRRIKQLTKNLGIAQKVTFWGFVNEEKKFELLSKAHLVINPSIREGWCLVVIEAASQGTPTIAFDVVGLRDSIVNNRTGILCKKNSVGCLSEEILKLMDDKKKYQMMSKNAILWSKKFSWERSIKQSLRLIKKYKKLL